METLKGIDYNKYGTMTTEALITAGTYGLLGAQTILDWAPLIVVLIFIGKLSYEAFKYSHTLWKESNANEWMIVMQNGTMK
jgi:hypothetical protein